jgi:ankyrin repeat protein
VPEIREHPDIISAIMADDLEAVEGMLEAEPALAHRRGEQSPVLLAVYRYRLDILRALLARHPSLDIFEAAAAGDIQAVRACIEADPAAMQAYAADGFTPLHLAAFFGHEEVARVLIDAGARVDAVTRNDMENMPLHAAAAGRHHDICALLLDRGAPVNAQQEGGFTALHAAAQHGDMALARLLAEHGAAFDAETDDGRTAADLAYEFEHDELAAYLRRGG